MISRQEEALILLEKLLDPYLDLMSSQGGVLKAALYDKMRELRKTVTEERMSRGSKDTVSILQNFSQDMDEKLGWGSIISIGLKADAYDNLDGQLYSKYYPRPKRSKTQLISLYVASGMIKIIKGDE